MLGSLYLHSLSVHPHSVQCGLNYCVYYVYVMCCDSNKKKTGWTKNRTYTKRMSEKCLLFYLYTTHRSLTLSSDFCFACLACSFTHQFIVRIGIVCDTRLNITTVVLNIGWALNANFFFSLFRCNCNCSRIRYVIEQSVKSTSFFFLLHKNICVRIARKHMQQWQNDCQNHMPTNTDSRLFYCVLMLLLLICVDVSPFHRSVFVGVHVPEPHNKQGALRSFNFCAILYLFCPKSTEPIWMVLILMAVFFNFKGKRMNFLFFDS